jgi:hypothetical protein
VVLHRRRVRHERINFFPGLDGGGEEAGSRDKPIIFSISQDGRWAGLREFGRDCFEM